MEIELRKYIPFIYLYFRVVSLPLIKIDWKSKVNQKELDAVNKLLQTLGYYASEVGLLTTKGQDQLFALGAQLKSIYIDKLGLLPFNWNSSLSRFHSSPLS